MTSNSIVTWNLGHLSCYEEVVPKSVVWGTRTPLFEPLPVLYLQIALVVGSNLFFHFLLKRHNQPRIVRDLISTLVVSPFILEIFSQKLSEFIWPLAGNTNLSVLANLGVIYCMFIKGLQTDLTPLINRQGIKTLFLSFGIILIPFFIGCAFYNLFSNNDFTRMRGKAIFIYWGAILASSSFPTLASILAKLKLLSTDIGRESLCICLINDLVSWVLMVIVIAISAIPHTRHLEVWSWTPVVTVLLFTIIFGLICYIVIRTCIEHYVIKHEMDGEHYDDSIVIFMLILVMVCGLVSELFGSYAFVGAFFLGLATPHGAFSETLVEKMEDCVIRLLVPMYFALIGVKMKGIHISIWVKNISVALAATVLKPLCVYIFSIMCSLPHSDGFALAVLQNTKGLLSVVVAVIGFDRLHLTKEALSILILVILLSTATVGPIMSYCYKRVMKNNHLYQQKSVGELKPYDDFRVLACIQETHNIPGMLNLLEISNNSERSPMSVFGIHLMELIGKASAMLIVHQAGENDVSGSNNPFFSKKSDQSNQIISAFDSFRQKHMGTTNVQTLAVLSPMDSMHKDITNIAEDKQVCMIILSYHKHQGMDGKLEDGSNVQFRTVNQNVMRAAPCSVGLLIDRGSRMLPLGHSDSTRKGSGLISVGIVRVAMLYFGGPDDREALSFALRLARHPLVNFTLLHFVVGDNPANVDATSSFSDKDNTSAQPVYTESEVEKIMDDEFIHRCLKQTQSEKSVNYMEIKSNNGEETIAKLREMDNMHFNLYVVGRGERVYSPMTAGLAEWSENPELGVIGEVLVTSDLMADVSVVVVQQYLDARKAKPQLYSSIGLCHWHSS